MAVPLLRKRVGSGDRRQSRIQRRGPHGLQAETLALIPVLLLVRAKTSCREVQGTMIRILQWSLAGLVLTCMGCAAVAEKPLTGTVAKLSSETPARPAQEEAMLRTERGVLLFMQGDLERAGREFREAIRLSPNDPLPHNNLGMVFHAQGDLSGAIGEFFGALMLNPRLATARSNLGFALFDRGDLETAVEQWQIAVKLEPHLAGSWAGLALGLLGLGQEELAVRSYRVAIRLDGRYTNVEYLQRVRRWSPAAVGQAKAVLRLIDDSREVLHQKVMI